MCTKCPYCGSTDTAEYIYGMPVMDDEMKKDLEKGKVILAGCEIDSKGKKPLYLCNKCKKNF